MELDKTRIAIRERGFLDILDLALRTCREQLWPLALVSLLGVAPFFAVNLWLLNDAELWEILDPDAAGPELVSGWFGFIYVLLAMMLIELPFATAPITLFLGQITFSDRIDAKALLKDFLFSLPQLALYQLIPRMFLIPWFVTWFFPFVVWPYLNEIILLERNPWRKKRGSGDVGTLTRIPLLHTSNSADLMARAMTTALVAPLLTFSLWMSVWGVRCLLVEDWTFDPATATIYLQATLWVVVAFFAVVRFLSYLDLRIRNEGWELELRMRAEGARLTRQFA